MKTRSLFIEKLDSGAIIIEKGKKKAFESNTNATNYLIEAFKEMIEKMRSLQLKNMSINIEVDENLPTAN